MDKLSETFGALADPTRRAILARLLKARRQLVNLQNCSTFRVRRYQSIFVFSRTPTSSIVERMRNGDFVACVRRACKTPMNGSTVTGSIGKTALAVWQN